MSPRDHLSTFWLNAQAHGLRWALSYWWQTRRDDDPDREPEWATANWGIDGPTGVEGE